MAKIRIVYDDIVEAIISRGKQNERPPHCTGSAPVQCTALPPRRPIRGQQIYDSQSQSAMGGSAGTLYPGRPDTMYPHCPGQTGYIVRGTPDTMRGVLVLIAPTVKATCTIVCP